MARFPQKPGPASEYGPSPPASLIERAGELFAAKGVEAYLVGGAVRDWLLGRAFRDVDVAVAAHAESIGRDLASALGGHFVPLDEAREIVRVVVTGDEGAWFLDLSSFRGGIEEDLRRRDFTLDAMAVPLAEAAAGPPLKGVIDPHGGLADLRAGVIRAVAPSVFASDPARLMRAPRLAAQLGFKIAEDTVRRIQRDAYLVARVAPERIRDELLKLLAAPGATASLRCMDSLGLLLQVIPELAEAKGVTQPKEHHWDVFNHLVETASQVEMVAQAQGDDNGSVVGMVPRFESMNEHFAAQISDGHSRLTLLKLAGLLHDIAKPATRTVETTGRIRFLGHHVEGAEMAERILRRLRVGGRGVELVRLMVQHHLRPSQMAQKNELPTGKAIYRYFRDTGDAAIDTLYLNMADYLAARGPQLTEQEWREHCATIGHILREGLEQKAPLSLPTLLDGHDIMQTFSLSPGPKVGQLLGLVEEAWAGGEITTKEEALELVKANLEPGGGGA